MLQVILMICSKFFVEIRCGIDHFLIYLNAYNVEYLSVSQFGIKAFIIIAAKNFTDYMSKVKAGTCAKLKVKRLKSTVRLGI